MYDIVVPGTANGEPMAVVLDFHGFGNSILEEAAGSGLARRALAEGFIAVFPRGSDLDGTTPAYFNLETVDDPSLADDVGFTAEILDDVEADLCVDRRKIFATGLSNGGAFASTLACALGDRIAAVAPVAGVLLLPDCDGRPVPIVITHGTADPVVPFSETDVGPHTLFLIRELVLGTGGNDAQRRMITAITATSVTSWAESWANRNGCRPDAPEVASPAPGVHVTTYRDCQAGGNVVLQVIEGGGHDWPTSPGFNAIAEVLEFFWSHPLPVEALR